MAGPGTDLFISYAREDQEFVVALARRLAEADRTAWVDVDDIPPTAEWMTEIREAIDAASAFCFVLSPASAASPVCGDELAHALGAGKRIIPIVHRDVEPADAPPAVAARNWLFFRAEDDADAAFARLLAAMDTDLDWVRDHTRLLVRAREWDERGRPRSLVLRGDELADAEAALAGSAGHDPPPTPTQVEYVTESRRSATRTQRLRLAAVGTALVVALVLGAVALVQRNRAAHERDVARAQSLAASARAELDTDPELSVILAAEAYRQEPTAEAEEVLRQSISQSDIEHTLDFGGAAIVAVAYLGEDRAATAAADGVVRIWRIESGEQVDEIDTGRGLTAMAASLDGARIVTGDAEGVATVWDVDSGQALREVRGHDGGVTALAVSLDRQEVASASGSGDILIWATDTGEAQRHLRGHRSTVNDVAFNILGDQLVSGGDDQTVRVWDLDTGGSPTVFDDDAGPVSAVVFHPAGVSVIEVGPFTSGFEVSTTSGQTVDGAPTTNPAADVAVSLNGDAVYLAGTDGVVRIWDRSAFRIVGELRGLGRDLTSIALSPDGRTLITGGRDGISRILDPGRLEQYGGSSGAFRAAIAPDEELVATADLDGVTRIWGRDAVLVDHELGELLPPSRSEDAIRDLAFSPDGGTIAVAAGEHVRLWDVESGEEALDHQIEPEASDDLAGPDERSSRSVAFTPDGDRLVIARGNGSVGLLDVESGEETVLLTEGHDGGILEAAVSPDGETVLTAGDDGTVRLWDLDTGDQIRSFDGHQGPVLSAQFDAAGERIVTGGSDATSRVWDVSTGEEILSLEGHEGIVIRSRFDPSGQLVITASLDGFARVWDTVTGDLVAQDEGDPLTGVTDAAFGPDGTLLVVSREAALVRCRACVPDDQLLDLAHERSTRAPTEDEQARYGL